MGAGGMLWRHGGLSRAMMQHMPGQNQTYPVREMV